MKAYIVFDDENDMVAVCLQKSYADAIVDSWAPCGVEYYVQERDISAEFDCPKGHPVGNPDGEITGCDECERPYSIDELVLRPDTVKVE